ncbi:MAG: molybdopterin adenylyltransferase [Rhizobiales bacterium PAR1]|nr:MAG: molybdopterin adenylyltransferase [Rhizobiales bacterium PAR1]
MSQPKPTRIGIVTISDRASQGIYADESGPAIRKVLDEIVTSPWEPLIRIIPDGIASVSECLATLADKEGCDLILTTGGTGPAPRDLTPEAVRAVVDRELPGFGEVMRRISFETVPTAILSRQLAGTRGACLIVTLPGKPGSIRTCLDAVFPAIPYCLDLIGAARLETDPARCCAFRPPA